MKQPVIADGGLVWRSMNQQAPYPVELEAIVLNLKVTNKPLWSFYLEDDFIRDRDDDGASLSQGLTFIVKIDEQDAYHDDVPHRRVNHYFIVPAATYDSDTWRDWVLARLVDVQVHETCEGFEIGDEHPYAPNHGPGRDPYTVFHYATDEQRRTQFTGKVKDPVA